MTANRKANTAIICLSPYHGGMEMDAVRIARLVSPSTTVTLIAKHGAPIETQYRGELEQQNIHVETVSFKRYFSINIIRNVRKILVDRKIRNVIYFGASELRSLYFSFLFLNINLLIRHGTTKSKPKKDFLHQLLYSKVDCHIATNVRHIIPLGKKTKLKTIYSSLRTTGALSKRNLQIERPVKRLHVDRIAEGKGQINAIEACEILHKNNTPFTLHLVGSFDPKQESRLRNCLNQQPWRNCVRIEGFHADVSEYYETADAFLFPTRERD